MDILKTMKEFISGIVNSDKALDKTRVTELVDLSINIASSSLTELQNLSEKDKVRMSDIYRNLKAPSKESNDLYKHIADLKYNLSGRAKSIESKYTFASVEETLRMYISVLNEIHSKLDTLIEEDTILLKDSRVSYMMIVGVLREVEIFINVFNYMFTHYTVSVYRDTLVLSPYTYQTRYIVERYDTFVNIINMSLNTNNSNIVSEIIKARRSQNDPVFCSGSTDCLASINLKEFSELSKIRVVQGIAGFNMVGGIKRLWDVRKQERYERNKAFKAKLEAQVSLMKLKLAGMEQDSPEAMNLMKVIEMYDGEIAKLDRKISEYEGD